MFQHHPHPRFHLWESLQDSWLVLLAGGLMVLAGCIVYCNSFHGPFVFDDYGSVLDNPTIEHLSSIGTVLSPPGNGATVSGRPVLNLSLAINYALSGTEVRGYHVTNLVIHLLNGLLLLGILRQTFLLPALQPRFGRAALLLSSAIALLWVVHPLQTESVTYIAQRAESLSAMFYLLTLYAVIRGSLPGRTLLWFSLAVAACWLGVATKEIVATAPVMVLLYDRTLLAGTFRQAWQQRWKLYGGLVASWGLFIGLIFQRGFVTTAMEPDAPGFWWTYARSQPGVILYYLRLSVWPHPLCLEHYWQPADTGLAIYGPMLMVGLLLAITIWGLRRSDVIIRAWGLLGVWFFLILAPSSSVVPLIQLACEHRMYLPLVAVITLFVTGAYMVGKKWLVRGRLMVGLGTLIFGAAVLGFLTFQRNQDYRSKLALWESEIAKSPRNPVAYYNCGNALWALGRLPEALARYEQALQIHTNYDAHRSCGEVLVELGRPAEALAHYQEAVRLKPDDAEAYCAWGNALTMLGRSAEALPYYQEAVRFKPNYAEAHYNWGTALFQRGHLEESMEHFRQAVRFKPNYPEAYSNWGTALLRLNRLPEAVRQYEQTLRLNPNHVQAQFNLYHVLMRMGQIRGAIEHGLETARLLPDNPQVHQEVAWLLATHDPSEGGNGIEAVKLALRACELTQQKDAVCLDTLAAAYAATGQFDKALTTAQEAEQLARTAGQNSLANEILKRWQLYRNLRTKQR